MENPKGIFKAIPAVMADVGAIGKNGRNDHGKYNFRSIDDVYNSLQPVLSKHKVFFVPTVIESTDEKSETKSGSKQSRVRLRVKYSIFTDDGSSLEAVVEGEGIDTSDKATNKALQAAFKYMLLQVFCIAVEGMEDADKDSPPLNFVKEKLEVPNLAPKSGGSVDLKITDGKYKGKKVSEVPSAELKAYVAEVIAALSLSGRKEQKWFTVLREAVGA